MNTSEYEKLANRTAPKDNFDADRRLSTKMDLLHAVIGCGTETGELLDAVKRHVFYGTELDTTNVHEELGDLMWYIALACESLGFDLEGIMEQNIEKLKARYPNKYSNEAALERADKNEDANFDLVIAIGRMSTEHATRFWRRFGEELSLNELVASIKKEGRMNEAKDYMSSMKEGLV